MSPQQRRYYSQVEHWTGPGTKKRKHKHQFIVCLCCRSPGNTRVWYRAAKRWDERRWRREEGLI